MLVSVPIPVFWIDPSKVYCTAVPLLMSWGGDVVEHPLPMWSLHKLKEPPMKSLRVALVVCDDRVSSRKLPIQGTLVRPPKCSSR
jgi:hypothetical protein